MSSSRLEQGQLDIGKIVQEIRPFAEAISLCAGGKLSLLKRPRLLLRRAHVFLIIPPLWESGRN